MNARHILWVGCSVVAIACSAVVAQQPTNPVPTQPAMAPVEFQQLLWAQDGLAQRAGSQSDQGQISKLTKQYMKAEKDDEKKEVRKKLSELLAKQFDQHVAQQQKELENLEKQIATLRETLKKRVDGKGAIVDRRLEQLILDAQGMGWNVPSTPRTSLNLPTPPAPAAVPPAKKKD